ncbi:uncharacterized protein LOC124124623 [Haliotis rufescens]|uniref:uncharacterized protein LOC124124623 n=1 Tax=Haliotis rufescens TaxID=6454 RepID=UPI00201FACD5|nr:uncharacterized protein LOC124124623 [Haliotis rufescens]XP_046343794.2 uncharacterized protein LOC124124623 [Haliotis rufescens]
MVWPYTSWYALIGACLSSFGLVGLGAMLSIWACYHITQRLSTRSIWGELNTSRSDLGQSGSTSATKDDVCRVDVDDNDVLTDELCPATVTAGVGTLRQVAVASLHDLLQDLATLRPPGYAQRPSTSPSPTHTEDPHRDASPSTPENVTIPVPRPNTERRISLLTRHLPVCETLEGEYVPVSDIPTYMATTTSSSTEMLNHTIAPMMSTSVAEPTSSAALSSPPCTDDHSAYVHAVSTTTPAGADAFRTYVNHQVEAIFPQDSTRRETYKSIAEEILFASTAQLVTDAVFRAFRVTLGVLRQWDLEHTLVGVLPRETPGEITHQVQFVLNTVTFTWDKNKYGPDFLQTMSQLAQDIRGRERQPSCSEYLAFQLAYHKLAQGCRLNLPTHMPIGSPGFRPHTQTYLSFTDPGERHVQGTTRHLKRMQGTIIHVETPSRLPVEHPAQTQPSLLGLAKVRLHTGSAAPTSACAGAAIGHSEHGEFDEQFWQTVHLVSNEATAVFHHGAAECKVSMDGLSTSQAVRYMRALTAHVSRERFSQYLSAAWNVNQIIIDDYEREKPRHLVNNQHIAMRTLEITSLGGFDVVILDGGKGDSHPKDMVGFEEALAFNHEAHVRGLVTYFSAGFKFDEIKHAVFAGVDGIGIGGAQVLRYMDSDSGMHGPYTEENIPRILQSRDDAAKSVRGRGVHLLVRLDTMFFEGTISQQQNILRAQLFKALQSKRKAEIENLLNDLCVVCSEATDSRHRVAGTAGRLCRATAPLLQQVAESQTEWRVFITRLRLFVHAKDYLNLAEEYESEPWLTYRQKYADTLKA